MGPRPPHNRWRSRVHKGQEGALQHCDCLITKSTTRLSAVSALPEIIKQAAIAMRAALGAARAGLPHSLSTGEANEETVRKFMRDHLPSSIGVTKGFVFDSKGGSSRRDGVSRQADVILYDEARTPMLFTSSEGGQQSVPSEGVIAVIEVKTSIDKSDVPGIIQHMQSVKRLDKTAYYPRTGAIVHTTDMYGKSFTSAPTMYFVFSFESGKLYDIGEEFNRLQGDLPVDKRVDCVCVLDNGVILNADPEGKVQGLPGPGTVMHGYQSSNALLMFYILISTYLLQIHFDPIRLLAYVPDDFRY